jgi:hypothetical protein
VLLARVVSESDWPDNIALGGKWFMRSYSFDVDGPVDFSAFSREWEIQRALNVWPPVKFEWHGNSLRATVDSDNVPERELRKMLNFALGPQSRRLVER